jgi:eukaryotic-like serine/threonine-protein kinase
LALTPGTRLGPYEIVTQIGAGGMGDVYRARDPRLHRDVAIKTLQVGKPLDDSARLSPPARDLGY